MWIEIKKFFGSFSFYSGILKTIAVLLSVFIGWKLGFAQTGLTAAITIIMISPSDIPGNRKHHLFGIAMATFLVAISLVCIELTRNNLFLLLPTMGILVFLYAYISLYGTRASMVSIAGIFSVALTFAQERTSQELVYAVVSVLLAGAGYIFLVQVLMWIRPRHYSEQLLGKTMRVTAEYFTIRASLLTDTNRKINQQKLLNLQTELNESYEKLREVLLSAQSKSGKTNYLQRQFLIFIEMVDIFELAIATPIPYKKLDKLFPDKQIITQYSLFLNEISSVLLQLSAYIGKRKNIKTITSYRTSLENFKKHIKTYSDKHSLHQYQEQIIFLNNLYKYAEQQLQKIDQIVHIFTNYYTKEIGFRDEKTFRQFVSTPNYSLKRIIDHFSINSPYFRYAIRLSVVTIIGFLIGKYFELQNSYWILFTIYVIMRPGYAVTKQRSKERIYGTMIGAIISSLIIISCQYLFPTEAYRVIYGIIIVLCMPFAYGLLQENFSISVVFITIYIILIYAIFVDNALIVLQYRVIDTAIGVVLSLVANYVLFPSWEHHQYKTLLINSLRDTINYIDEVLLRCNTTFRPVNVYKVARKKAFLSLSNLNAGLQRMLQEPKSKQRSYPLFSEIIVLQQDFISVVSALWLQKEDFKNVTQESLFVDALLQTKNQLQNALSLLENQEEQYIIQHSVFQEIQNKQISQSLQEDKLYNEIILYKEKVLYLFRLSEKIYQWIKKM